MFREAPELSSQVGLAISVAAVASHALGYSTPRMPALLH
jgi:hypothetical protein